MRDPVVRRYLLAVAALLVVFTVVPDVSWAQVFTQVAVGYLAAAGVLVGMVRHKLVLRRIWWGLAIGIAGNATGIFLESFSERILDQHGSVSWADIGYLSLYPCVITSIAVLIRRRSAGRDFPALIDTTIVTTGLALLAWVFVIRPAAGDPTLSLAGRLVSIAYPLGDVILVAMLVRLRLGAGTKPKSYLLMSGALASFLAGDVGWAVCNEVDFDPGPITHRLLSACFLLGYTLLGLAALHPSVTEVTLRGGAPGPRLGIGLLALLTGASLIAPLLLLEQALRHAIADPLAISLFCVALFLLVVTRMAQLVKELERQTHRVKMLSRIDELTGLPNRRSWNTELPEAIERARRQRRPLSVAMLDLDHFKDFNDEYGHPGGDRLLKAAAATWREQLRAVDHLARYGGEEFVVLLPDTSTATAIEIIGRLLLATPQGQTFSSGVATWNGTETADDLVARADAALYAAKRAGRNRVLVAGDVLHARASGSGAQA